MKTSIVIGLGEVGLPLFNILQAAYPEGTWGYDYQAGKEGWQKKWPHFKGHDPDSVDIMHVCFPWSAYFMEEVYNYSMKYRAHIIVIHSTVPIGTCSKISPYTVHSPVMGRHDNMEESLKRIPKWVGGPLYKEVCEHLRLAGFRTVPCPQPETTEALKLMSLAKYGMSIAFAHYQKTICDKYGFNFDRVIEWDKAYNEAVRAGMQRPLIVPMGDTIGGHCVIPGVQMLNEQVPNQILAETLKYSGESNYTIWQPCNIFPTAKIGKDVSIGAFSEVGPGVIIGDNVRIGAHAFIPEGVEIEEDAWIGPRVTFSNDRYPPSGRDKWQKTLVKKGARLGAGVCVLPGVTIGEGGMVGMGSVVTKDVQNGVVVAGNPAKPTFAQDHRWRISGEGSIQKCNTSCSDSIRFAQGCHDDEDPDCEGCVFQLYNCD